MVHFLELIVLKQAICLSNILLLELILAAYNRLPTDQEMKTALAHVAQRPKKREEAHEDIQWAILNSKEFLFQH